MGKKKIIKNIMNAIRNFIEKESSTIRSVLVFLFILFFWFIFESRLMNLFDEYIFPLLSVHELINMSNIIKYTSIVVVMLVFFWLADRIRKYKYRIPILPIFLLCFFVYLYVNYRISGFKNTYYVSVPAIFWKVGYTDILIFFLCILLLLLLWYFLSSLFFLKDNKVANAPAFLLDTPIDKPDADILDYSSSIKKLASDLETIDAETSFSVGLIAPWGTGKTSYMNLLDKAVDKEKFIVIKFNPRHSLSSKNIQKDFFEKLSSELSKYDSRFSSTLTNYLKAINVLAESKGISTFLGIHKLWDKNSVKEKINNTIRKINKRIIIIIDDFDRLLAEEIIEIFKLIDGNASFTNFIFITAYDKSFVNNIIGGSYSNQKSYFSEKFFTLEIPIPIQPYKKIHKYLSKKLFEGLSVNLEDKECYQAVLAKHFELFEKYLTTIRDVKRFLNSFIGNYKQLLGEVKFEDFFLLYLIKYRYYDEYRSLFKKDYFKATDCINMFGASYHIKEDLKVNSKEILEILFPETATYSLRSINNKEAFNIYFYEFVYDSLTIREMETVFNSSLEDAKLFIDETASSDKFKNLIEFLNSKDILTFGSKEKFERYLDLLLYINCKNYDTNYYPYYFTRDFLSAKEIPELLKTYTYTEQEYKGLLAQKIKGEYPDYQDNITKGIITTLLNKDILEPIIFTKDEVLSIAKSALDDLINNDNEVKKNHIDLLYSCISDINPTTHYITLDEESCSKIKNLIVINPAGYFDNFVRLGMHTFRPDYNSVACEPFWEQIFKNKNEVENLINTNRSQIPNFSLISNFWELYKNNNYNPIPFESQGNVQEKINNNLKAEALNLRKVLDIESRFNTSEQSRSQTLRSQENVGYLKKYKALLIRIENIHLHVTKRVEIIQKIEDTIHEIEINLSL